MPKCRLHAASGWLAVFLSLCAVAPARASRFAIREFGVADGFTQIGVSALAQDHEGTLWIGTSSGLNRFDGEAFDVFTTDHGLPSAQVRALMVDRRGLLWVGTKRGLARGPVDGRFVTLPHRIEKIVALAESPDGVLWIGGMDGLHRWDPRTEDVERVETGLPGEQVLSLVLDGDGRPVLGGGGSTVARLDERGMFQVQSFAVGDDPPPAAVGRDAAGHVWVARRGHVFPWDRPDEGVQLRFGEAYVRDIDFGADGSMWVTTTEGAVWIEGRSQEWFRRESGLDFDQVSTTLVDHEGSVWFGGDVGLGYWDSPAWRTFTTSDGLTSEGVRCVYRARDGRLFVGTRAGLVVEDGGQFERVGERDLRALCMLEDRTGRLLVGTSDGLFELRGETWHHLESLGSNWVDQIVEDQRGHLWASTRHEPLRRSTDGFHFEIVDVPGQSFSNGRILVHSSGHVYVSGDQGLSRFDGANWTTMGVKDGLAWHEPYFLVEGPDGGVWFGYHGPYGFSRLLDGRIRTWTTKDGLTDPNVHSLGFGGDGDLWLGSSRGVDRFDGEGFVNYGPEHGYASAESNSNGFLHDRDGTIWFGTAQGLARLDPRRIEIERPEPDLRIRRIEFGDRDLVEGSKLSPRTEDLELELVLGNFVRRDEIDLRYRLLGEHDGWQPLSDLHLRVPNLGPGHYVLEVQARVGDGPWRPARTFAWGVESPWWRSPLSVVLLGFLALTTLTVFVAHMIAQGRSRGALHRRMPEIGAMAARIDELERECTRLEQLGDRRIAFLADMSHEVRTPLSGVIGMVSLLGETTLDEEQQQFLEITQRSSDQLLTVVNEILDLSRLEAGRMELAHESFDLVDLVESVVDNCSGRAVENEVELVLDLDPHAPRRLRGDENRLRQVLINLVGNAVKFAAQGVVVLRVDRRESGQLHFAVEDTGVGIPADRIAGLFDAYVQADATSSVRVGGSGLGLAIASQIVRLMGGRIDVRSEVGVGSVFEFQVQLGIEEDVPPPTVPWRESVCVLAANALLGEGMTRMLSIDGYDVESSTYDAATLSALLERGADCVIVDESFGPVTAADLIARLQKSSVTAIVALHPLGQAPEGLPPGVERLAKPVKGRALRQAIRRALDGSFPSVAPQVGSGLED